MLTLIIIVSFEHRSYTMESSFCGCDQGILAGLHLDIGHLKAIGRDFCQALSMMKEADEDWIIGKYVKRCCVFIFL